MEHLINNLIIGSSPPEAPFVLPIRWAAACRNVLYKHTLKVSFLVAAHLFFQKVMSDRWYGVQPLCFRVGSNRQCKALSCGIVAALALPISTCPTNSICQIKGRFQWSADIALRDFMACKIRLPFLGKFNMAGSSSTGRAGVLTSRRGFKSHHPASFKKGVLYK